MRIKSLYLAGFKSFLEPSKLPIEPGLTGVVGPNGCGKSNLFEAMRWVMGAGSAKAMRGAAMEDVIFAGSDKRGARSRATVSLSLNELSADVAARFEAGEELEISREIRKGLGSTYRINGKAIRVNGKAIRAKDVHLLFADNASGANSPAFVRQGQISELIQARPANRRKILEEAAGITGLNARRHESELKLGAAQTNLDRLDDQIKLYEHELSALRRQARQAEKFKKLSAQIRLLEHQLGKAKTRLAAELLEKLRKRQAEDSSSLSKYRKEALSCAAQITKIETDQIPLRDQQMKFTAIAAKLEAEINQIEQNQKSAEEKREKFETDCQKNEEELTYWHCRICELETDKKNNITAIEQLPTPDELSQKNAITKKEIVQRKNHIHELVSALEAKQSHKISTEANLAHLQAQKRELDASLATLNNQIEKLQSEKGALIQSADHAIRDLSGNEKRLALLQTRLTQSESACSQLNRKQESARERLKELGDQQEELGRREGELLTQKKMLQELLQQDRRKQNDVELPTALDQLQVPQGLEAAVAAVLGEFAQDPVGSDDQASVWMEINRTNTAPANKFPPGAQPLDKFLKLPKALQLRFSFAALVEEDQAPLVNLQLSPGQMLVTKRGDIWRWDGHQRLIKAGMLPAQQFLARKNQLSKIVALLTPLQKELEQIRKDISEAESNLEKDKIQLQQSETELTEIRTEINSLATISAELRIVENSAKLNLESFENRRLQYENDQLQLTEKRSQIAAKFHQHRPDKQGAAAEEIKSLASKIETEKQELDALQQRFHRRRAECDQLKDQERRLQAEKKRLDEELQQAKQRSEKLEKEKLGLEKRRAEFEAEKPDFEKLRHVLMSELRSRQAENTKHADRLASYEKELKSLREENIALERKISGLTTSLQSLDEQSDIAQKQQAEALEKYDFLQKNAPISRQDQITANHEELELPLDENSMVESEKRLEKLKNDRHQMGGINLNAHEESEARRRELESVFAQRADIVEAISQLRGAISQLNKKGREKLRIAFDEVNKGFAHLFGTLFGGGEARLELIDSDDILEAGLEIYASPPGKKLKAMSLMSGGEQALTTIALIFAVFNTNPAPICILDEVDAPLDDVNVDRFCQLLDVMKQNNGAQFLVITHNAITMSRMDRLFGVTMEEKGISKLVSVDLQIAEQLIAV